MFPQLRLTPTRAAFARPGPHATAFPDVLAPMQPSDSLAPFGRRSGHPSPTAYLGAEARSSPSHRCPRGPVQRRRHFYPGSPQAGSLPRRNEGIPGAWVNLFGRAVVFDPAGCVPPLAHLAVRSPSPSSYPKPSAPGIFANFGATYPRPTRSRTYASPDPLPVPAQGSLPARAGSPLAGRDSHPLDDEQGFMKSSHTPFLLDQPCLVAPDKWRTAICGCSDHRCG